MALSDNTRVSVQGRFEFHQHGNDLVILNTETEEDVELTPAEASKLIPLFATIGGMVNFKSLPPTIVDTPFRITFSSTGECLLERDKEEKGVHFKMEETDVLNVGVRTILNKIKDMIAIRGGPTAGVPAFDSPEPVLEGRD
ncbi:MAG: hypothetical protein ACE5KG_01785 [Nitrososphaerales archaeon]